MVQENSYKLYGFLNFYRWIPDFVYPVYQRDGELYFAHGTPTHIEKFVCLKPEIKDKVCTLPECSWQCNEGDKQVYIYQASETDIWVDQGPRLCKRLYSQKGKVTLLMEIEEFIEQFEAELQSSATVEIKIIYGRGQWKRATANVCLKNGNGKIIVNKKDAKDYFVTESCRKLIIYPLRVTNTLEMYDMEVNVRGGRRIEQANAVRKGIEHALLRLNKGYRRALGKLRPMEFRRTRRKRKGKERSSQLRNKKVKKRA